MVGGPRRCRLRARLCLVHHVPDDGRRLRDGRRRLLPTAARHGYAFHGARGDAARLPPDPRGRARLRSPHPALRARRHAPRRARRSRPRRWGVGSIAVGALYGLLLWLLAGLVHRATCWVQYMRASEALVQVFAYVVFFGIAVGSYLSYIGPRKSREPDWMTHSHSRYGRSGARRKPA